MRLFERVVYKQEMANLAVGENGITLFKIPDNRSKALVKLCHFLKQKSIRHNYT